MTPEQEIAKKKQLVSAARSLLSLQSGLGVGCTRISKLLTWLGNGYPGRYPVFEQFLQATLSYPIGNERLQWAHQPLLELDARLAVVESGFRGEILKSCVAIIEAHAQPDLEPKDHP